MTLLLSRGDIAALMGPADYLDAVEAGFRAVHDGSATVPPPWHVDGDGGGFHGKGASLRLDGLYVALKLNGNFPGNPERGLPTVQGAILLCDGGDGRVLAIMDSIEVTLRRTAAATALAARFLARPGSHRLAICGCGAQAEAQLEALRGVLPIDTVTCWDRDRDKAQSFAGSIGGKAVRGVEDAVAEADIIVTVTSAGRPFLTADIVAPGAFVAAVGADSPAKSEIAPDLMTRARVVVDSLDQCLAMGDLRHAVAAGAMSAGDVHAELAELVGGVKPGRRGEDEITLFDSTGTAVQDVAAAAVIYRRAVAASAGREIDLGA